MSTEIMGNSDESLMFLLHEIKTPVNVIYGFSQLLLEDTCTEKDHLFYTQMIIKASEQLMSSLDELISYCKGEEKNKLYETFFDSGRTIDALYQLYKPIAARKGLMLKKILSGCQSGVFLLSNEQILKRILENLLSNAIKYTENGTVEFGCKVSAKRQVTFFVRDTGIGIKPEDLSQIFKLFYRTPDAIKNNINGTGLGLAIVCRLSKLLGTKIRTESEYGKGSHFWFNLGITPKSGTNRCLLPSS